MWQQLTGFKFIRSKETGHPIAIQIFGRDADLAIPSRWSGRARKYSRLLHTSTRLDSSAKMNAQGALR